MAVCVEKMAAGDRRCAGRSAAVRCGVSLVRRAARPAGCGRMEAMLISPRGEARPRLARGARRSLAWPRCTSARCLSAPARPAASGYVRRAGRSAASPAAAGTGASAGADGARGIGGHRARTARPTLHWQACTGQLAGLECASLQVPLNYADPGGRKITLALSMVPATAPAAAAAGRAARQPGRPGRARPVARGRGRVRGQPAGARPTTTSWASTRAASAAPARAELRPELLRRGAAGLHPGERGGRAGADQPGEGLRGRVREAVRLVPAVR